MTIRIRTATYVALVLLVGLAAGYTEAKAASPRLLGEYRDWRAYRVTTDAGPMCYAYSSPTESLPKRASRGRVFIAVSHRPSDNVRNEVSVRQGYPLKNSPRPYVSIGPKRFSMFAGEAGEDSHWVWLDDAIKDKRLVAEMKKGKVMIIKGTSARGTTTTDRYSLMGVSAALQRIDKACK